MYFVIKKSGHIYAVDDLPEKARERAVKEEFLIIDSDKKSFLGKTGSWASVPVIEQDNKHSVATEGRFKGGAIV